ncbi:MAG TPA: FGGY family carbohydrate kinase, partial [Tepidisphaeraceae bacterium]
MKVLAVDIGSSSVKAAILTGPGVPRRQARVPFATRYEAGRAEVDFDAITAATKAAIARLGTASRRVDLIVPTGMAPSWLALDKGGHALTPVVTHQDRRSVDEALAIEGRIGRQRHLSICGNRPTPGGISSTTAAWFIRRAPGAMRRARLVGHLNTALLHAWCGVRVADPSNAGFSGLYRTRDFGGWSDELCESAGVPLSLLPDVLDASAVAGRVTTGGASAWGLREGTPVLAGLMDGSCAMLLAGGGALKAGQMVNVIGSTDVLAAAVDRFKPHPHLLTRPLGAGRIWLSVGTLAAAGTAVDWLQRTCFGEMTTPRFHAHLADVAAGATTQSLYGGVLQFDAQLAGRRTAIEPLWGSIRGLSLAATRDELLLKLLANLARESARRLPLLASR